MDSGDWQSQLFLQVVGDIDFWPNLKKIVWEYWEPIALRVEAIKKTLDPAIWFVGSILALVPGTYAIYKWWHYRDSRLPLRLLELLEKEDSRLSQDARSAMLQAVKTPDAARANVTAPIFAVPALKTTLRNLNWASWRSPFPFDTAEAELASALSQIEQQLLFGEKSRAHFRRQQAVAYIVKGSISSARAVSQRATPESADQDNRKALYDFNRALDINPNDSEALEYVALQQRVLRMDSQALTSYERLIGLTQAAGAEGQLVSARAHRNIGEILEKQYDESRTGLRLTDARRRLEAAYAALPQSAVGTLDEAVIREAQGRLAEKDEAAQLPSTRYNQAIGIYSEIADRNPNDKVAVDGVRRVRAAVKAFERKAAQSKLNDQVG